MKNKGQSLVLFVMLLPIIIMIFALIFDSAIIIIGNNKLKNITTDAITYLVKDNMNETDIENIIKANESNLITLDISKEKGMIHLKQHINSYFGKIIGYNYYEIETNYHGYIKNNKLIIEEKG